MSEEEALQILDTIPTIGNQVDALEMAIDALEKQRPMEPGPDELGIFVWDPVITPCGNCGMGLTDRMWDFCPWCGQKIEWRKK